MVFIPQVCRHGQQLLECHLADRLAMMTYPHLLLPLIRHAILQAPSPRPYLLPLVAHTPPAQWLQLAIMPHHDLAMLCNWLPRVFKLMISPRTTSTQKCREVQGKEAIRPSEGLDMRISQARTSATTIGSTQSALPMVDLLYYGLSVKIRPFTPSQ